MMCRSEHILLKVLVQFRESKLESVSTESSIIISLWINNINKYFELLCKFGYDTYMKRPDTCIIKQKNLKSRDQKEMCIKMSCICYGGNMYFQKSSTYHIFATLCRQISQWFVWQYGLLAHTTGNISSNVYFTFQQLQRKCTDDHAYHIKYVLIQPEAYDVIIIHRYKVL